MKINPMYFYTTKAPFNNTLFTPFTLLRKYFLLMSTRTNINTNTNRYVYNKNTII